MKGGTLYQLLDIKFQQLFLESIGGGKSHVLCSPQGLQINTEWLGIETHIVLLILLKGAECILDYSLILHFLIMIFQRGTLSAGII